MVLFVFGVYAKRTRQVERTLNRKRLVFRISFKDRSAFIREHTLASLGLWTAALEEMEFSATSLNTTE